MSDSEFRIRERMFSQPGLHRFDQRPIGKYFFRADESSFGGAQADRFYSLTELGTTATVNSEVPFDYDKREITMDEIHKGPPWTSGGEFQKVSVEVPAFKPIGVGTYTSAAAFPNGPLGYGWLRYVGGFNNPYFFGDDENAHFYSPFSTPNLLALVPNVSDLGPKAWHMLAPKIESSGLYVFLSESRDIPRMLETTSKAFHETWKSATRGIPNKIKDSWHMQPKNVADNYVNHQFGWSPFVGDVVSSLKTYINADEYISRLTRNNGKYIRKKKVLEEKISTHVLSSGVGQLAWPTFAYYAGEPGMFTGPPMYEVSLTESIRTSAVGRFRYYLSQFDDSNKAIYNQAINTVMRYCAINGLRVNPSNIYRATPWTWLADWVSNLGDNIANLSTMLEDGMTSDYFYVMHHKSSRVTLKQTLPFGSGSVTLSWSRVIETKQRTSNVSPFGFSLSTELSARQKAILAALGISRRG